MSRVVGVGVHEREFQIAQRAHEHVVEQVCEVSAQTSYLVLTRPRARNPGGRRGGARDGAGLDDGLTSGQPQQFGLRGRAQAPLPQGGLSCEPRAKQRVAGVEHPAPERWEVAGVYQLRPARLRLFGGEELRGRGVEVEDVALSRGDEDRVRRAVREREPGNGVRPGAHVLS